MEEKKNESSYDHHGEKTTTTISVLAAAACSDSSSSGDRRRKKEKAAAMDILDSLTTIRSTRTRGGGGGRGSAASSATKRAPVSSKLPPPEKNSLSLVATTSAATAAAAAPIKKLPPPLLQRGGGVGRGKKNVKQRRGSASSAASSTASAATTVILPVQQQQQQRRRQTSASAVAAAATATTNQQQQQNQRRKQRKLPVIIVESDENPRRLVNPLTEWPPCTSASASSTFAAALSTATASSGTTPSSPTTAAGISPSHSTSATSSGDQACELWPLQDIFHPLPDTYSIAYMARLLGFQLPPPPVPEPPIRAGSNYSYKPVPLPANLEIERDDGYQVIPRRGTFVDAIYKNGKRHVHGAATQDADDCRTLDVLDPLYEALLLQNDTNNNEAAAATATANHDTTTTRRPSLCSSASSSSSFLAMTKPVTTAHQQRLLQAGTFGMAWSDTLQLARTYMIQDDYGNDDSDDMAAATSSNNDNTNSPSSSNTSTSWKVSTLADFQREQQQLQEQDPNSNPLPVPLTHRLPDFLSSSSRKPVANECGIFLWSNNTAKSNNTCSTIDDNDITDTAPDTVASDLLVGVVMYQFVWYCHGNNQAGVVLNIRDIFNTNGVSCLDESNYSSTAIVDDDNQHEEEKRRPEAATTAPLLSMSQLLLLTSLVLQHARAAQIWYVTLLVPSRLQGFFATFFRMVPSAKSVSSASPTTTTTMVRMVCDLNKCSTRYAFLLYKQFEGGRCSVLDMIPPKDETTTTSSTTTTTPFRALVRLPNVDEVRVALKPPTIVAPLRSNNRRTTNTNGTNSVYFTSASNRMRQVAVGVRVQFSQKAAAEYNDDNDVRGGNGEQDDGRELQECSLLQLDPVSRQVGGPIDLPPFYAEPRYVCFEFLKRWFHCSIELVALTI
jgi:hypothetical protein